MQSIARALPLPTRETPGTPEKIEVLRRRAAAGLALFHPKDATADGVSTARLSVGSLGQAKAGGIRHPGVTVTRFDFKRGISRWRARLWWEGRLVSCGHHATELAARQALARTRKQLIAQAGAPTRRAA